MHFFQDIVTRVLACLNLSSSGSGDHVPNPDHYALVEVWRDVCRVIQSSTLVLPLWTSWAQELVQLQITFNQLLPISPHCIGLYSFKKYDFSGGRNNFEKFSPHFFHVHISGVEKCKNLSKIAFSGETWERIAIFWGVKSLKNLLFASSFQ